MSKKYKSESEMNLKMPKKPIKFDDQKCSFCGWARKDHANNYCYHYSDQDSDYFYNDKTFKP